MHPLMPIAAAILLGACTSLDTHRNACAEMLGRPTDAQGTGEVPSAPGGPQEVPPGAKPQPTDPAVEACAQQRSADEQRQVEQGILVGAGAALLIGAAALLGASSAPSHRGRYYDRSRYRRR